MKKIIQAEKATYQLNQHNQLSQIKSINHKKVYHFLAQAALSKI